MTRKLEFWHCNPELETEWERFARESNHCPRKNNVSDMWLSFLSLKESSEDYDNILSSSSSYDTGDLCEKAHFSHSPKEEIEEDSITVEDNLISASQHQQISALTLELLDMLETSVISSVPEELHQELSSLSLSATQQLLTEMAPQLSEQGVYNLCLSLSQSDNCPWIDVNSVFKFILLPMVCGDSSKSVGAEFAAGILHLSSKFPTYCVSSLLKPLFAVQASAIAQLELVSRVVPLLPPPDFLSLLRHIVDLCSGPLQGWQLSVLNTLLSKIEPDETNSSIECILLSLIPVLSASSSQFSSNESFGCLLLKIILCLKNGVSPKVHAELSTIAHQSSSFNKRAILNAIKTLKT